ncbi:hypothetical protein PIB30_096702 [Stylosanthes scabra]|uniref:Aminotransferase-like plant mobile domain-containing protein n=1 Tax=Stylosanthes scabra TaxID=79078 RepID=A0ABU6YV02_9FABA|nr:hypothetical protein [Stylosanthes scabra]
MRSDNINRKNADGWHIATALDIESPRILHSQRNSHVMATPEMLMTYFRDTGFGQAVMLTDFHFDLTLLSAFVERWRPETHNFHMSWGEVSISPSRMWPTISDYALTVIRLVGPCGTSRHFIGTRRGVGLRSC